MEEKIIFTFYTNRKEVDQDKDRIENFIYQIGKKYCGFSTGILYHVPLYKKKDAITGMLLVGFLIAAAIFPPISIVFFIGAGICATLIAFTKSTRIRVKNFLIKIWRKVQLKKVAKVKFQVHENLEIKRQRKKEKESLYKFLHDYPIIKMLWKNKFTRIFRNRGVRGMAEELEIDEDKNDEIIEKQKELHKLVFPHVKDEKYIKSLVETELGKVGFVITDEHLNDGYNDLKLFDDILNENNALNFNDKDDLMDSLLELQEKNHQKSEDQEKDMERSFETIKEKYRKAYLDLYQDSIAIQDKGIDSQRREELIKKMDDSKKIIDDTHEEVIKNFVKEKYIDQIKKERTVFPVISNKYKNNGSEEIQGFYRILENNPLQLYYYGEIAITEKVKNHSELLAKANDKILNSQSILKSFLSFLSSLSFFNDKEKEMQGKIDHIIKEKGIDGLMERANDEKYHKDLLLADAMAKKIQNLIENFENKIEGIYKKNQSYLEKANDFKKRRDEIINQVGADRLKEAGNNDLNDYNREVIEMDNLVKAIKPNFYHNEVKVNEEKFNKIEEKCKLLEAKLFKEEKYKNSSIKKIDNIIEFISEYKKTNKVISPQLKVTLDDLKKSESYEFISKKRKYKSKINEYLDDILLEIETSNRSVKISTQLEKENNEKDEDYENILTILEGLKKAILNITLKLDMEENISDSQEGSMLSEINIHVDISSLKSRVLDAISGGLGEELKDEKKKGFLEKFINAAQKKIRNVFSKENKKENRKYFLEELANEVFGNISNNEIINNIYKNNEDKREFLELFLNLKNNTKKTEDILQDKKPTNCNKIKEALNELKGYLERFKESMEVSVSNETPTLTFRGRAAREKEKKSIKTLQPVVKNNEYNPFGESLDDDLEGAEFNLNNLFHDPAGPSNQPTSVDSGISDETVILDHSFGNDGEYDPFEEEEVSSQRTFAQSVGSAELPAQSDAQASSGDPFEEEGENFQETFDESVSTVVGSKEFPAQSTLLNSEISEGSEKQLNIEHQQIEIEKPAFQDTPSLQENPSVAEDKSNLIRMVDIPLKQLVFYVINRVEDEERKKDLKELAQVVLKPIPNDLIMSNDIVISNLREMAQVTFKKVVILKTPTKCDKVEKTLYKLGLHLNSLPIKQLVFYVINSVEDEKIKKDLKKLAQVVLKDISNDLIISNNIFISNLREMARVTFEKVVISEGSTKCDKVEKALCELGEDLGILSKNKEEGYIPLEELGEDLNSLPKGKEKELTFLKGIYKINPFKRKDKKDLQEFTNKRVGKMNHLLNF